jgi:hypothetical protein
MQQRPGWQTLVLAACWNHLGSFQGQHLLSPQSSDAICLDNLGLCSWKLPSGSEYIATHWVLGTQKSSRVLSLLCSLKGSQGLSS